MRMRIMLIKYDKTGKLLKVRGMRKKNDRSHATASSGNTARPISSQSFLLLFLFRHFSGFVLVWFGLVKLQQQTYSAANNCKLLFIWLSLSCMCNLNAVVRRLFAATIHHYFEWKRTKLEL